METMNEKEDCEGGEHLEKKDCPLSPTDWVMFLNDKITTEVTTQSASETMIIAAMLALFGVMAGVICAFMSMNPELARMGFPSLVMFVLVFPCVIFVPLLIVGIITGRTSKKKIKRLEKLIEDIIDGEENDTNKIRERWKEISMKKR
jgi:VIT1/CCC1 family predicted Fe2+/Mn2+ transporter